MAKFSVITSDKIRARIKEVKQDLTYDELFTYLLDLTEFRTDLKGITKAELMLKKWLAYGYEQAITPSELRRWVSVNLNACKDVISRYEKEVEKHNLRFK